MLRSGMIEGGDSLQAGSAKGKLNQFFLEVGEGGDVSFKLPRDVVWEIDRTGLDRGLVVRAVVSREIDRIVWGFINGRREREFLERVLEKGGYAAVILVMSGVDQGIVTLLRNKALRRLGEYAAKPKVTVSASLGVQLMLALYTLALVLHRPPDLIVYSWLEERLSEVLHGLGAEKQSQGALEQHQGEATRASGGRSSGFEAPKNRGAARAGGGQSSIEWWLV